MFSLNRVKICRIKDGVQVFSVAGFLPDNRKSFMDAIYQISGLHHGIYPAFDPRVFKGGLDIDFLRQSIDVMYRDFQLIGQFSGDAL